MKVRLVQAAALAAWLAACSTFSERHLSPEEVISVDLDALPERRGELDGHWVEFQGYVLRHARGDLLIAVPGEEMRLADGRARTICRGTADTNLPIVLRHGFGPLQLRDLDPLLNRQRRVRIRAIFHSADFSVQDAMLLTRYPGYFDNATVVEVTDQWCDLY